MAQNYGIPASAPGHPQTPPRSAARYLVLIDSAADGGRVARLFSPAREPLAELGAGAPEVAAMIDGRAPQGDGQTVEWAAALAGHSDAERAAARVFLLDL